MGLLVYAVPKVVYEAPIQGLTGMWGGVGSNLTGGGGYDWDHIRFDVGTNVPASETDDPPTSAYIKAGLSSPTGDSLVWKESTDRLSVDGGIITLLIPEDGNYKFTIRGADGAPFNTTLDPGNQTLGSSMYGAGATVVGTMSLQKDQVVGMLMGMTPSGGESGSTGTAGGGGTFIYAAPAVGNNDGFGSNTLYFAAGGGGGWGHGKSTNVGGSGGQAPHNSITMAPGGGTGSGGSGGNSGGGTRNNGGGGKGGGSPTTNGNGGAGAGWQGAGGDSQSGCSGGNWTNEGLLEGGSGNQNGGWGGGGGACGNGIAGGGGGGYSGGDGGNGWDEHRWGGGAGGGSYSNPQATQTSGTTNQSLGEGQSGEHGFIQIEKL